MDELIEIPVEALQAGMSIDPINNRLLGSDGSVWVDVYCKRDEFENKLLSDNPTPGRLMVYGRKALS